MNYAVWHYPRFLFVEISALLQRPWVRGCFTNRCAKTAKFFHAFFFSPFRIIVYEKKTSHRKPDVMFYFWHMEMEMLWPKALMQWQVYLATQNQEFLRPPSHDLRRHGPGGQPSSDIHQPSIFLYNYCNIDNWDFYRPVIVYGWDTK